MLAGIAPDEPTLVYRVRGEDQLSSASKATASNLSDGKSRDYFAVARIHSRTSGKRLTEGRRPKPTKHSMGGVD